MNAEDMSKAVTSLNELAEAEYHRPLKEVLATKDPTDGAMALGRLVGVMLKEPFSTCRLHNVPSPHSGAYRGWELSRENDAIRTKESTWQHHAIAEICREVAPARDVSSLCWDAHYEHGFFGYFAQVLRKYICGDKTIRKHVSNAIKSASKGGKKLPELTPEQIVGAGGLALGAFLVQHIPILGMVGAPVVAAVVLMLYRLGVDAFCQWTASLRTEQIESH